MKKLCLLLFLLLYSVGVRAQTYNELGNMVTINGQDSNKIVFFPDEMGSDTMLVISNPCDLHPLPIITSSKGFSFCQGDSAILTAPTSLHYLWSTGDTTKSIVVRQSGAFFVSTTGTLHCIKTSLPITITVNPLPLAKTGSGQSICQGLTATIGYTTISGSAYSWTSSPSGFASSNSSPVISPSVTTSYTLIETIIASGCSKSNSVTVSINPLPAASTGSTKSICYTQTTASIGGSGISGNTYSWSPNSGLNSNSSSNPSASPTVTTTYTLMETVTSTRCTKSNDVFVIVNPLPLADAGSNKSICTGNSTTIGKTAVLGNTYSWLPTAGLSSSTSSSTGASPTISTTYTLTETITSTRCTQSNSVIVTVNPLPAANVGSNKSICFGVSTTIGGVQVSGSTYSWFPATGLSSNSIASPIANPSITTSYKLIETNSNGCEKSDSVVVTVNPLPAAGVISNTSICTGNSANIGTSAVIGSSYSWISSPAGFSSTVANPSVNPSATTTYTLTETNSNGCVKSNTIAITVNPLPAAGIISNSSICIGNSINIGSSAITGRSYSWTSVPIGYSSTVANPFVNPSATTTYTLTETIQATGCSKNNSLIITVNPLPDAYAGNTMSICYTQTTAFIGGTAISGNTYSWSPSSGLNSNSSSKPTASPTISTTYTLIETIIFTGCSKSNDVAVIVNPLPLADVGSNKSICIGNSTTIGKSPITRNSYSWYPSSGLSSSTSSNPIANPTVTTTYSLTETITATGCTQTNSIIVTVNPLPAASVGINKGICLGQSITIGGTQVSGSSYSWYPSTGLSSNLDANPTSSPSVTTTYKLTETNSNGCVKSDSVLVTVYPIPQASFGTSANQCLSGNKIYLTDKSTVSSGNISSWKWDLGDSNITTSQNNSHSYKKEGTFLVKLTTISNFGCKNDTSKTVTIYPQSVVNYDINNPGQCLSSNNFGFNNKSTIISGSISSFLWNFGDSLSSTSQNCAHSYLNAKNYNVILNVVSDMGCRDSISKMLTVYPQPDASFYLSSTGECLKGNSLNFRDESKVATGIIKTGVFRFGDGDSSLTANSSHSYKFKGSYTATHIVSTDNGCVNSLAKSLVIFPMPKASFSPVDNQCKKGNLYNFNDLSTVSPGSIKAWNWSFGDGIISKVQNPNYSYKSAGTFKVTLTTTTDSGCSDSTLRTLKVFPMPIAKFTINQTVQCFKNNNFMLNDDSSSAPSSSILTWLWEFGDGKWDYGPGGRHSYLKPGNYSIQYTLTNDHICNDTMSKNIVVNPMPDDTIKGLDNICQEGITTYSVKREVGSKYKWAISGGDILLNTDSPIVSVKWVTPGVGTLEIFKTNSFNCSNNGVKNVNVYPNPLPNIFVGSKLCIDSAYILNDSTITPLKSSFWSFGDGDSSTTKNPTHVFKNLGKYKIALNVISSHGCADSASKQITINPLPNSNWYANHYGKIYYFHAMDSLKKNYQYQWQIGDGLSLNGHLVKHLYPSNKFYPVQLKITDANGCINKLDSSVNITVSGIELLRSNNKFDLSIYPNPFSHSTRAEYRLEKRAYVKIRLLDLNGKQIALITDENQDIGSHKIDIDAEKYQLMPGTYMLNFIIDGEGIAENIIKL